MKIIVSCCLLFFSVQGVTAQRPDTTGSNALFEKLMSQINSRHVQWVKRTAKTVHEKKQEEAEIRTHTSQYALLGSMNGQDIEALAFLVLMQAAKSAQEDLKSIMAQVKAINEQKKALRHVLDKLKKQDTVIKRHHYDSLRSLLGAHPDLRTSKTKMVSRAELNRLSTDIMNAMDAQNKKEEEQQLRLQMMMDRMNRMMTTLSNLLKKISDTANTIIQNLK